MRRTNLRDAKKLPHLLGTDASGRGFLATLGASGRAAPCRLRTTSTVTSAVSSNGGQTRHSARSRPNYGAPTVRGMQRVTSASSVNNGTCYTPFQLRANEAETARWMTMFRTMLAPHKCACAVATIEAHVSHTRAWLRLHLGGNEV